MKNAFNFDDDSESPLKSAQEKRIAHREYGTFWSSFGRTFGGVLGFTSAVLICLGALYFVAKYYFKATMY